MFGNMEQSSSLNQERIQSLKEKIKSIDSIYPKATALSSYASQNLHPINEYQSQPQKQFAKTFYQKQSFLPLEARYYEVQQKFALRAQNEQKILEKIDNQVQILQEQTRLVKKAVQRSRQLREQKVADFQKEINDEVHEQIQEIKATRKELIDSIQKKYRTIKSETMSVLGSQFENGWQQTREELIGKVEEVRNKMDAEETLRDEEVTSTVNHFGEEILKLEQLIQKQKDQRMESHQKLLHSILEMQENISSSIYQQRKESALGIAELQGSLQQLCFKIENYLLH